MNATHFRGIGLRHFFRAIGETHHPRPFFADQWLRYFQHRRKLIVKSARNIPC